MSILIKTVRISGFRGLKNIEVELEQTTLLTGMNNTGKTSFLKALQLALGNRQFITQDDFFIQGNQASEKIIIDLLIIPVESSGQQVKNFSENWETVFTENRIRLNDAGYSQVPLRTIITFDSVKNNYQSQQFILQTWSIFNQGEKNWFDVDNGTKTNLNHDAIPFFFMDAQRDILEDMKLRTSYLGKMLAKIEYSKEAVNDIETQIKLLNEKAVSSSGILSTIKDTLKELDTAMNTQSAGIEITPFTKKIRDLSKGLSIYYTDQQDSFSMEYHGMGTRSWSSLLTLKSFISLLQENADKEDVPLFPVLAIEEPEAHLHPNAQKKLYGQIHSIAGQKIISTHSPYIAAAAKLSQIRNFYKDKTVQCGQININNLSTEDVRKINRQVINTRGEIFFSKIIVFCEGETEEQVLPILAKAHFKKSPVELGLDFIGVSGHSNYLPFFHFANDLNIPWIIFSDGEKVAQKSINKVLKKLYNGEINLEVEGNIIVLDREADFEKYLINCGYIEEIKAAFAKLHSDTYLEDYIKNKDGTVSKRTKTNETCSTCQQHIYTDILRDYDGNNGFKSALYDCMTAQKTKFGSVIADEIINSDKDFPPKIKALFQTIEDILKRGFNNVIT